MPKISYITPTYNRKELLGKCIRSVLSQKQDIPFEWEMIIIDDGSNDDTKSFIQTYLSEYSNIHYEYRENRGMNNARNAAFDLLAEDSDYLILLDSDDELKEDCIYTCLSKFEQVDPDSTQYLGLFFFAEDEYGNLIGNKEFLQEKAQKDITYDDYLRGFIPFEPGFIFRSTFFHDQKNRFDADIPSGGTGVLWAKWWKEEMGRNQKKFLFFDYIGRIYRQNNVGRLTFEFTKNKKRFWENATSGDRTLAIIKEDMLSHGYTKLYGEALFRIGINYLLSGENTVGKSQIKKSLQYKISPIQLSIFLLAWIHPRLVYSFYRLYTTLEYRFIKK